MATSTTVWLTACLHYNEPWEPFLANAVKPYTDVVLQAGVADCFFFERSWEQGPNVRLWFRGSADVLHNVLMPNLVEHFQTYFDAFPSSLAQPGQPPGLSEACQCHPKDSVQFLSRAPAAERSDKEMMNCRVFQAASLLALHEMKQRAAEWSPDLALELAMKAHLGMLYASGLRQPDAARFFTWQHEVWPASQKSSNYAAPILRHMDVPAYVMANWELFRNSKLRDTVPFRAWMATCAAAQLDLELALHDGRLAQPVPRPSASVPLPADTWPFLAAYLRMTNNQLGIFGEAEGQLYAKLAHALHVATAFAEGFQKLELA